MTGAANVYLVGFMAAGKSTVAIRLAARLGWRAVDLDAVVTQRCGTAIATLFAEAGEAAFRRAEAEALAAVATGTRQVVATGGGVVLDPRNVARMRRTGAVVWLDVPLPVVLRRLAGRRTGRPLADGVDTEALATLHAARQPRYAAAADVRIVVADDEPDAIAARIATWLGQTRRLDRPAGAAGTTRRIRGGKAGTHGPAAPTGLAGEPAQPARPPDAEQP